MNRAKYAVEKMCQLFGISRSSYYSWLKRGSTESPGMDIGSHVQQIFKASKDTYGSPRIQSELRKKLGIEVSKSTVARVMKKIGVQARPRRRYVHTTDSKHDYKIFENILNRSFSSARVNEKWVSDISYIPTRAGWTYLTVVIDLADRMVVGWNLSKDMSALNTSVAAFNQALKRRKITSGILLHSDRGVQYCCVEFRNEVKQAKKVRQSMSRKGNCWDNAPAESFFKSLKTEWTSRFNYRNFDEAYRSIFDYIEKWYNTKRQHSTLDYMAPLQKYYFLTQPAA